MRFAITALLTCVGLFGGEFPVGSKLEQINLQLNGTPAVIKPSAAKATAVVFVSTQCPVSNAYNARFNELYRDYASKGVQFVFVNANSTEAQAEIDGHSKTHGFTFKVYKDANNDLADKLNAQYTPEVFLFDSKGTLAYHGRIDDQREIDKVAKKDTRTALDAMLSGQAVPVAETKAFGCAIKRVKRAS